MSRDLRALTGGLFVLPVVFCVAAAAAPSPAGAALVSVCAFMLLVYASVWFVWRPSRFTIDGEHLRIVWPLRSRAIARRDVVGVRIVDRSEFRRDFGWGVRIGAGGLWGGFGLLKTRRTTFSMWISRTDRVVLVELRGARPLLVTPEQPERFVTMLA